MPGRCRSPVGWRSTDHMNPVGVMGVGERELHHTPTLARTTIMQWMHKLRHYDYFEDTTLAKRIYELAPSVDSRCLFVVISDLHDPDGLQAIKFMAHNHDCMVIHLTDPVEKGRMGGGIFRAVEAETGREFVTHGRSSWIDHDFGKELTRVGVDYLHLPINEPILTRLRHFLKNRGGSRKAIGA